LIVCTLVVVCATAGVVSGAALAAGHSTFGTRFFGSGNTGFYEYGDEISIQVPDAASHSVASDEFELSRAVNQLAFGPDVPLIQIGLYRSGPNHFLDNCATSVDKYTYYKEINITGTDSGFVCHLFGAAPAGEVDNFEISNFQSNAEGDWNWGIAGPGGNGGGGLPIATGTTNMGFNVAIPMYGEEISSPSGVDCQTSSTGAHYGAPSGGFSGWNVYRRPNAGDLQPVTDQANTDWSTPNPPNWNDPPLTPWPETIHHSPC
jgi:hypothetical protein